MGTASSVVEPPAGTDELQEELVLQESGQQLAPDQTDREGNPLPEGTYKVHIIRPGVGRGRGRHLYEASMLERHAGVFKGWKMYLNHLSPEARKAAGGLPRNFEHLGGSIKESWWDPTVPGDDRFDSGAVVGIAKPVGMAKQILADDPEIAEVSISAHATGVKPVRHKGEKVLLVEGIHADGSVDWVTQAGAGGKVVGIAEALIEEARLGDSPTDLLEWLDDDAIADYVRTQRPELAEALGLADDETDETDADATETTPPPAADPSLPREADDQTTAEEATSAEGGDDMGEFTPEMLREALADPETKEVLKAILAEDSEARLQEQAEEFESRAELIRAEARADADRAIQLTRLEAEAARMIDEAKLPERWGKDLKAQYELDESGFPAPALDVVDEVDEDGNVTKRAMEVLRESVEADLTRQRELLAEVLPTRVRGQGTAVSAAQRDDAEVEEAEDKTPRQPAEKPYWAEYLQEAGIDPDKSFKSTEAAL